MHKEMSPTPLPPPWVIRDLLPRALGWDTIPLGALVSPFIKWVQGSSFLVLPSTPNPQQTRD